MPRVGRHGRAVSEGSAGIPSMPVGEKHRSGGEFSAAATVVEVRQRQPSLCSACAAERAFASIWHLVCSSRAMDAAHRGTGRRDS